MSTVWEITENAPPEEPPADSLAADPAAGELTGEDEAAIAGDVLLPAATDGAVP